MSSTLVRNCNKVGVGNCQHASISTYAFCLLWRMYTMWRKSYLIFAWIKHTQKTRRNKLREFWQFCEKFTTQFNQMLCVLWFLGDSRIVRIFLLHIFVILRTVIKNIWHLFFFLSLILSLFALCYRCETFGKNVFSVFPDRFRFIHVSCACLLRNNDDWVWLMHI